TNSSAGPSAHPFWSGSSRGRMLAGGKELDQHAGHARSGVMKGPRLSPETQVAQALGEIDPVTGALVPPISLSTNFEQAADGSYHQGRVYSRADNPTYEQAERMLAMLEGAAGGCILFASGMAAAIAVFSRSCRATMSWWRGCSIGASASGWPSSG